MTMFSRPWSYRCRESSTGSPAFVKEFGLWNDRQAAAARLVEAELDQIDLVRLAFCDPHGLARSKTLTADVFGTVLRNGMDFSPGPFTFDTGQSVAVDVFCDNPGVGVDELVGAGDFLVVPDPLTFQVLPGTAPRTAWVLGDEFLRDGTPHPLSTRNVLRRVCATYAGHDLEPVVGLEVEWYLTRRLDGPAGNQGNGFGRQGPAPTVAAMNAGYQFNLDSHYDSLAAVVDPLGSMFLELGLPLRSMEHETGPGQVEFTFSPMVALDAADAMLFFRTMTKQACARRGYHASFMSLPALDSFDPSGWHLHQSAVNTATGRNIFAADGTMTGLSPDGKAYVEGMLAGARELCLLSVPTVNGYRRFAPRFPLAPNRIGWSFEDRRAMVRAVGSGESTHVENRAGEPCANPYLAVAAQLFAGLDGLVGEPTPAGPMGSPDGTGPAEQAPGDELPGSLREALEAFRSGTRAEELLGGPLASCLEKLKESEVSRFEDWCSAERSADAGVTEWEHREYFGVF